MRAVPCRTLHAGQRASCINISSRKSLTTFPKSQAASLMAATTSESDGQPDMLHVTCMSHATHGRNRKKKFAQKEIMRRICKHVAHVLGYRIDEVVKI